LGAKLGDNAAIILAAILTACGVALLFLPWQALSIHADPNAPSFQNQQKGEIVVGISKPRPPVPETENPHKP
jgi:hypothetical protein